MFFDCMAIAVGLLASIMATWPPNERFTYGCVEIVPLRPRSEVLPYKLWPDRDIVRICEWNLFDIDINLHCL